MKAGGSLAVMQNRVTPRGRRATGENIARVDGAIPEVLEFFPTPPWATRALVRHVATPFGLPAAARAIDPCCGEGHMIETLRESYAAAEGSDIFDYGRGYQVRDAFDPARFAGAEDAAVFMNPPFGPALDLVRGCFRHDGFGRPAQLTPRAVFVFARSNWIEGQERYERLFRWQPPHVVAPFVERVPLVKGRYDPTASTATAYSWFGWLRDPAFPRNAHMLIPPCRAELETAEDVRRWCRPAATPLLEGAGA